MPQRIWAASNAGPAGAAVASARADEPSTISEFVPTSMKSRTRLSSVSPVARMPATMSGPTYAPSAGNMHGRRALVHRHTEVGCGRLRQPARRDRERRHRERLGVDAERELDHRHVAGDDDLVDLAGLDARLLAHLVGELLQRLVRRHLQHVRARSASIIVALIREITSAPNGCCVLSIERTAAGWPVSRSSSVATTVVVPRSNAIA